MLWLLLSVMCFPLWADVPVFDTYRDNITTPQVSNLFQYREVQTALYTGRLNIHIPLYNLKDPDFPLEISLGYNSEGFKPRKSSGYVGYNWFLNAGGCITREVKEFPDEKAINIGGDVCQYGMLYALRTGLVGKDCGDGIFDMNTDCVHKMGDGTYLLSNSPAVGIDYQPDIFHFDFCGYHGDFMIDNAGTATVISGDFVDIDLSKLEGKMCNASVAVNEPSPLKTSSITIKTLDGYEYVFGGDQTTIEYTIPLKDGGTSAKSVDPTINSWYLKQITAPNGRQMLFYYKRLDSTKSLWQFSEYNTFPTAQNSTPGTAIGNETTKYAAYSQTKQCILDSITIGGKYPLCITFHNSVSAHRQYAQGRCGQCKATFQLDSVVVKQGEKRLQRAELAYEYQSTNNESAKNYWRFLTSVRKQDEGEYLFGYSHACAYPLVDIPTNPSYSASIEDYYGYWKTSPVQGVLNTIVYPTGGKQILQYGKHQYHTHQFYKVNDYTSVELVNENKTGYIGGIRIESREIYDRDNTLIEKHTYNYNASGIYFDRTLIYCDKGNLVPNLGSSYSQLETHVGYSQVTDVVQKFPSGETCSIEYTFNTQRPYNSVSDGTIHIYKADKQSQQIDAFFSPVLCYSSVLCKYGKLLSKTYKDNNGNIVMTNTYDYNGVGRGLDIIGRKNKFTYGKSKEIVIFSTKIYTTVARKLQIYPDVLNQESVMQPRTGLVGTMKTTDYEYDDKQRIRQEVVLNSDGKEYFTSYRYPDEFSGTVVAENIRSNSIWCWQQLAKKHRVNQPIEVLNGFYKNETRYITSGRIYLHSIKDLTLRPMDSIPNLLPDTAIQMHKSIAENLYQWNMMEMRLKLSSPITDYQPISCTSICEKRDPRYTIVCKSVYTPDWIKLKTISPVGQPATTYQWDDIYLSAITIGNQTNTYTYIPYVGVSSTTDSRGVTTYYTYDSAGRLNEVYKIEDGKKCIIQSNYYHTARSVNE